LHKISFDPIRCRLMNLVSKTNKCIIQFEITKCISIKAFTSLQCNVEKSYEIKSYMTVQCNTPSSLIRHNPGNGEHRIQKVDGIVCITISNYLVDRIFCYKKYSKVMCLRYQSFKFGSVSGSLRPILRRM
jgi:hypothetical protein